MKRFIKALLERKKERCRHKVMRLTPYNKTWKCPVCGFEITTDKNKFYLP